MRWPVWMMWIVPLMVASTTHARITTNYTSISHEALLVKDLLERYAALGYGRNIRPRKNASEIVDVQVGMRLITLFVDTKLQVLTSSIWLRMLWFDDFLKWDPNDYGGIKYIILPYGSVWMPENLEIVNTAASNGDSTYELNVDLQVSYRGRVFFAPHRIIQSGCLLDMTNYPFDSHTCDLWLQSASRYDSQMNLKPYYKEPFDKSTYLSSFRDAVEWDVISNDSVRVPIPRDVGAYLMYSRRVSLKFSLGLRRRAGFTAIILCIPCIFLSFLTCVIFCLPPESSDRQSLAMGLFGSLFVTLLILLESAPPSAASVPKLGVYYVFSLFIIIAAIFMTALTTSLSNRTQKPPYWTAKLLLSGFAPLMCMRSQMKSKTKIKSTKQDQVELKQLECHKLDKPSENGHVKTEGECSNIRTQNEHIRDNENNEDGDYIERCSWTELSQVVDRFFFFLFVVINIIALFLFFPRPE